MKDITSTSFGLFIAFLLPGLEVLYTLSLWSSRIHRLFQTFLTSESNVGLFLLVISAAVTIGLIVSVLRWFIFEAWRHKGKRPSASDYAQLTVESKLIAFRAAIDEDYRYHQFYGATAIIVPIFYAGLLYSRWADSRTLTVVIILAPVFAAFDYLMYRAATKSFTSFSLRATFILEKEPRPIGGEKTNA